MIRLYTPESARHWKRRAALLLGLAIGLVVLALVVNIVLCTRVNTANAQTLQVTCIALFTLAGWACILLLYFAYAPAKAQAVHIGGMFSAENETYEGVLTIHKESFHIPKSVTVRKATLETAEGAVALSVSAGLVHQLPKNGTAVRVTTVRKYITGYEVLA